MAPVTQITAQKEYEKNLDMKKEDIQALREWIDKQPHLPKIEDVDIILFFQSCMYKVEFTKTTIDNYYTVRTHCPEFFSERSLSNKKIVQALNIGVYSMLPIPTEENYKIVYCKLIDYDSNLYVYSEALKAFCMTVDLGLYEEGTAPGHVIVFDMEGIHLGHLSKLSVVHMKKFLFYLQEALPFRLKQLHFLRAVPFMDKILALMKPFMKKELADVLYFHQTCESILKFIPLKCLPNDYGGEVQSIKELHENMIKRITENADFFVNDEQTKRVNESKRPGKAKNASELFGVEGNFKKLDID